MRGFLWFIMLTSFFNVEALALSHTISGKLINGRGTAEKIDGVRVALYFDNQQIDRTFTDDQGNFQLNVSTSVEENDALVRNFKLEQNYPNPFYSNTRIQYSLPGTGEVRVEIFNVLGQKVRSFTAKNQNAGNYQLIWDGRDELGNRCRTGNYFFRLQFKDQVAVKKMCLLNTPIIARKSSHNFNYSLPKKNIDNQWELRISDRDLQDTTIVLNYDSNLSELNLGNIRVHVFPFLRQRPDTLSLMSGESISDTLDIYFEKPFNLTAKNSEIAWNFTADSLVEITYFNVTNSPIWLQIQENGATNITYGMAYFSLSPRLGLADRKLRYGFVGVNYEDTLRIKNSIGNCQVQLISTLPENFAFTYPLISGAPSDTLDEMLYFTLIDDRKIQVTDSARLVVWQPFDIDVNAYILDVLQEYPRDGTHPYNWVNTYDGVTRDLFYKNERIAKANPDGSRSCYCCGLTYEVFFRAMKRLNSDLRRGEDIHGMTPSDMRYLKYLWFVQSMWGDGPGIGMEFYGIGDKIENWDEIRPGDFVQLWRTSGSGHSVIFIDWVRDLNGEPMGIYYWSTQGSTNGINFNTEYFSGKGGNVDPDLTYFSRVRSPEKFTPFLAKYPAELEWLIDSDVPIFPKDFMKND